ncbi:restriction endonuclease subunit S [uncultured Duncaniella sp.]|uniref:restriction endonuclease subunit S n=2 Tax=uncultured Duncaniella sp. TaxID=2768039 RepID=UPI0026F3D940|nr:restriction endonuclease subunit S [uncultured Duncaniella sp.]
MSHYQKFEIPESWRWVSIDEIADVVTGSTPSKDHKEYYGGDVPFYKPSDLEQGLFTSTASDWLTPKGYEQARKLPKDSVLVTCIGATIGKTGRIVTEGSCNQQINAVILHNDILSEYFYDVCLSDYFQSEIKNNASATTLPILNKNNFSSIEIPLPPRNEQKRILEEVNKLFSIIGNIESCESTIISSIDVAKSKILELAMQGKLVPQDPDDEPAADMLRRVNPKARIITDNPHYPQLPDNWVYVRVSDVAALLSGRDMGSESCNIKNKGVPYLIGASNITKGTFSFNRWTTQPQVISKKDDILISCKGTIGELLKNTYGDIHIARQFMAIRNYECIRPDFMQYAILNNLTSIRKKANGIIPGISRSIILELAIPLPPMNEQDMIILRIKESESLLDSIEHILN